MKQKLCLFLRKLYERRSLKLGTVVACRNAEKKKKVDEL